MKRELGAAAIVALCSFGLGAGITKGLYAPAQAQAEVTAAQRAHLNGVFATAVTQVQRRYIAPQSEQRLVEAGIRAMLNSLDGRSDYLNATATAALTAPPVASAGSLGLLTMDDPAGALVYGLIPGEPAALGGVEVGDHILAVNGQGLIGAPPGRVQQRLGGPVGSQARLTLARKDARIELPLSRARQATGGVSGRLEGPYGYLRIGKFGETTAQQATQAVAALWGEAPQMRGLILDLRSSPGGPPEAATGVLDLFLDGGRLFQVTGRAPRAAQSFSARGGDLMRGRPMAVLVDSATSSGAEVAAAVLQERRRAKVVGLRTFGAGAVQTLIPMNGGAAGSIKLTTGLLETAAGYQIQQAGVVPDVMVAGSREDADRVQTDRHGTLEASRPSALGKAPVKTAGAPLAPPAGFDPRTGDFQLARARAVLDAASPAGR